MSRTAATDPKSAIHSDPEIMGGTPVFVGTRVPVRNLIDYLEAGDSLETFLDAFPSVSREQAVAALELAGDFLTACCVRGGHDLRELVRRIPKDNQPEEVGWGPPAGREVW